MKKAYFLLISFLFIGFTTSVYSQARVAYVDTEYILDKLTEYKSAQKQLDDLSEGWKKDIQTQSDDIGKLYKAYQAEWVLLPEDARKKREEEISKKEKDLNDFKMAKFGPEGELFQKRQQLIKPIQDKVFDAVQKLAKESAIDIIFDKAGAVTMLYSNAKYDRSDEVLDLLGIKDPNKK